MINYVYENPNSDLIERLEDEIAFKRDNISQLRSEIREIESEIQYLREHWN